MALALFLSLNGVALGDGPAFTVIGAEIVLTELGQFSASTVTLAASDERALLALTPYTLVEVVQDDLGTVAWGYVLSPRQQITDRDEHTLTLRLEPVTVECTWRRTGPLWTAEAPLSVVAARLGSLVPGWTGVFTDAHAVGPDGQSLDITAGVTLDNPTVLGAFLQTAKDYAQYVRMGVGFGGSPTDTNTSLPVRTLEMGQFGALATVCLTSADGADAAAVRTNDLVRLVATVEYSPADVADLVNVCVPFGGGQDATSLVSLERLWRIVNDPTYVNYGRYGPNADSIARTGLASVFPEYDHVNYPLSDPENSPTGQTQWTFLDTAGNVVGGSYGVGVSHDANGAPVLTAYNAQGFPVPGIVPTLAQGQFGTRRFSTQGQALYCVFDRASYAAYGFREGQLVDSSLNYADTSVANQETTARALYVAATTQFKRYAHPHRTFTCTAPGIGRPTRAGDLIAVDYQRISVNAARALVELDVRDTLKVMRVVRTFPGDEPPMDTYTLSNLGRFEADDATGAADMARQMVALQYSNGTGLAPYTRDFAGNIDAANPITLWVYVPRQHFRWHEFRVQCDWFPFRGTATTALNQSGQYVVTVGDVELLIATPAAITAQSAPIGGAPSHFHRVPVGGGGFNLNIPSVPYNAQPNRSVWFGGNGNVNSDGTGGMTLEGAGYIGSVKTGTEMYLVDLNPTAHPHPVKSAGETVGHIPAGTSLGPLPLHSHDVEKRIPTGTPSPASITFSISGVALSSGASVQGTRNTSGAFTSPFVANDISSVMNVVGTPGTVVPLRFEAGTSPGNGYGVGFLAISVTAVEELGGLSTTIRAT